MREGPAAALPVQQQASSSTHPQAVGVSLSDLQGQVPFLTQSSNNKLRTMSEPVPLLRCAPDPLAAHAPRWERMDTSPRCDTTKPTFRLNGYPEGSQTSDMEVSDRGSGAAECFKHCETISAEQEELNTDDAPGANRLSASASQDCSLELLIIKHKPSAIVFCDHEHTSDAQLVFATETSDTGESSSSITEEEEYNNNDDEDGFPETIHYQEFLVSRRRRNLSRNRVGLRNRQDAHPKNIASSWRKPTNGGQPEPTCSQEGQEPRRNDGKQVGRTRRESRQGAAGPAQTFFCCQ